MGIAQYIVYFLAGMFLIFVMGAYLTVSAGVSSLGVVMIFAPMVIAWVCSGLSFFIPRISAWTTIALTLPYFYVGITTSIDPPPASEPWVFLIPASIITAVSIVAILKPAKSIWLRTNSFWMRIVVILFAICPAAWGAIVSARFFSEITSIQ